MSSKFTSLAAVTSFALVLILSACNGGEAPLVTPATGPEGAAGQATIAAGKLARVRFTIRIPAKHRHRGDRYISPATRSMNVTVARAGKKLLSQNVNLTPSSKGCDVTFAGTICSLGVDVAPGSGYILTLTAYDGLKGKGHVLSTGQRTAFTVSPGEVNSVSLTLDGVPAKILVQQADSTTIFVTALDADGNFIAGPGAPVFQGSKTSGSAIVAIRQPSTSAPNTIGFTLASSHPATSATETIGVTAKYAAGTGNPCAKAGAVCSKRTAATISYSAQLFFAADYGNQAVKGFSIPFTGANEAPRFTLPAIYPYAAGVDTNGNVFAVDYSGGDLYAFSAPYTSAPATTSSSTVDTSAELAFNSAHDVFVTDYQDSKVQEFSPPYTGTPTTISAGVDGPYGSAVDANDNLYIANYTNSTLGVYAKGAYTTEKYTVPLATGAYMAARIGSRLYVGEAAEVEVFALPITSSAATPVITISNGVDGVYSVAIDSKGDLFVANYSGHDITEYPAPLTTGEAPSVTLSSGLSSPCGEMTFDGKGNLYVIDYTKAQIVQFDPPFTNSSTPAGTSSVMSDPCYGGIVNSPAFALSVP